MENDLFQTGAIGVFAMLVIREGINLFKWVFSSRKNGNGKDSKQDVDLAVLKEKIIAIEINHLPHIQAQLDVCSINITDVRVSMARLEEKIDMLLKK